MGLHFGLYYQAWKRLAGRESNIYIASLANLDKTAVLDAVNYGLDTQKSKPDPEVFLIAADRLSIPYAECLVIEDSDTGIAAAKAGGMYVLVVGATKGNVSVDYHVKNLVGLERNLLL